MGENSEVNSKLLKKMHELGRVQNPDTSTLEEDPGKTSEKPPVKPPAHFIERYVNMGKTKPEETSQPNLPNQQK